MKTDGYTLTLEVPEADHAEQQLPVDGADDAAGLDPDYLKDALGTEADPADLFDQAVSVPLPMDDYEIDL
ncbi:hypothetical protein A5707_21350 [Mycobacterium kyorinense]|uniref:Uncharacterized protein n=1 Tax=Mycobacterium kyorinense TaxID=487514 RepID=A0A1A2Z734_9MYCO|nr:hypothetical protein [Mycobacterium kyorinense]OBI46379.1 hypothetical protein A5707_21350 [Mycobacterium kyorinense]